MGNLLRLLSTDDCYSLPKSDIFLDFETSLPTEKEAELYAEAEGMLSESRDILEKLRSYKGATKEIREAISKPTVESESAAWTALRPLVSKLRTFYSFSKRLDVIVPKILRVLCNANNEDAAATASAVGGKSFSIAEQLDDHQALVKQLAKVLEFVLKFDECKMATPAVQNDFSFYRRSVQRNRSTSSRQHRPVAVAATSNSDSTEIVFEEEIPVDVTNAMSLFFAHATPMLNSLSLVVTNYVQSGENSAVKSNTTDMLSVMSKVCQRMLDTPELRSRIKFEETEAFILRVMTATVILYDHVHPSGAFAKGSCVDVKGCVKVLRDARDKTQSESLLNALRYTTRNLNSESTPRSIRNLLLEEFV